MYVQVRRKFGRIVSCVLSVVLAVQPVLAQAQSITLVSPGGGPRPHVDMSQNGTTVLNISTPNAAGVSHDRYSDFQAGDLIVNNSATITGTTLGGFVEGNANLSPGREADLWIGEVVGGNATQLTGILEVAGPSMDMVLANEFGITCNGCGFINTGRATLTTGSPQFGANGSLSGFDVHQGTVTIGAGGLNPENRVALSDASRVDVIARAAQVYGAMRGDRLNIVAGANQVDYDWSYNPDTGETSGITEQAGAGPAPALAVDVAALGGMYANAIRLVATENGVGVRLNGEMASSSDIAIRADGRLTLGAPSGSYTPQIRSRNRVSIRNQGPLVLEGSITSETGDLIDITATNDNLTFTGEARGGAITLESSGLARIEGALIAQDALSIRSSLGAVEVAAGAKLFAGSASLGAADTVQFAGQADVDGAVDMMAGPSVTLTGTSAVQGKTFSATADSVVAAGVLDIEEALAVTADDLTVSGTVEGGVVDADVTGTALITGGMAGRTRLDVNAAALTVGPTALLYGGQVALTGTDLDLSGKVTSDAGLTLSATTSLSNAAAVRGAQIVASAGGAFANSGILSATDTATLTAGGTLTNTGLVSAQDISLRAGGYTDIASAIVHAGGQLLVETGGALSTQGTFKSAGLAQFTLGGASILNGAVQAENVDILAANALALGSGLDLSARDGLIIDAQSITGGLNAAQFTRIEAGNRLAIILASGGLSIASNQRVEVGTDLYLELADSITNYGHLQSRGALTLITDGDIINSQSVLKSSGLMGLFAENGTVRNISALIEADAGLVISAQALENRYVSVSTRSVPTTVTVNGAARSWSGSLPPEGCSRSISSDFISQSDLDNATCGSYPVGFGGGRLRWASGTEVISQGARPEIVSGGGLNLTLAGQVSNDAGLIAASGAVDVTAAKVNQTGYVGTSNAFEVRITRTTAPVTSQNDGNRQVSSVTYNVSAVDIVTPSGPSRLIGDILGGGAVDINAGGVVNNGRIEAGSTAIPGLQVTDVIAAPVFAAIAAPTDTALPNGTFAGPTSVSANLADLIAPEDSASTIADMLKEGTTQGDDSASLAAFLTSNALMDVDRLQYRDELVQNGNSGDEASANNAPRAPPVGVLSDQARADLSASLETDFTTLVTTPTNYVAPSDLLLNGQGALSIPLAPRTPRTLRTVALPVIPAGAGADLSITAGNIIGDNGVFAAADDLILQATSGSLALRGGAISGGDLALNAAENVILHGTDITSRGSTRIVAVRDISIAAAETDRTYDWANQTSRVVSLDLPELVIGGELSLTSLGDTTLSAARVAVAGSATINAAGNVIFGAQSAVLDQARTGRNWSETLFTSVANVTSLQTGGDVAITSGVDAEFVGTVINSAGNVSVQAARDIVLTAAQDIETSTYDYEFSGLLSEKRIAIDRLSVTNAGTQITADGDISVVAGTTSAGDLITAGSSFDSRAGNITLASELGQVRLGTITDVQQDREQRSRSRFGGLLSSDRSSFVRQEITTGTDVLAGLDLSVVSADNTALIGARLGAEGTLTISSGADLVIEGAVSTLETRFSENNTGLVTIATEVERSFDETVTHTSFAGNTIAFDVAGTTTLVVYSDATDGIDSPAERGATTAQGYTLPQIFGADDISALYPEELLALDGLSLVEQDLQHTYFYEETVAISPAFKALASIAVGNWVGAVGTVGIAQSLLNVPAGWLATGVDAFVSHAIVGSVEGVVTGNFDIGEIVEGAAFAGLSAGLTSGIDINFPNGHPFNDALIDGFGSSQLTVSGLLNAGLDGAISSGVASAAYGTDFGNGVLGAVVSYVASGVAGAAIEGVSDIYGHDRFSIEKLVAKATINCLAAEAQGASCGSGALGSLVAEIVTTSELSLGADNLEEHRNRVELVGALAGYFVSGGEADNVYATAHAAVLDYDNNCLGPAAIYCGYLVAAAIFGATAADVIITAVEAKQIAELGLTCQQTKGRADCDAFMAASLEYGVEAGVAWGVGAAIPGDKTVMAVLGWVSRRGGDDVKRAVDTVVETAAGGATNRTDDVLLLPKPTSVGSARRAEPGVASHGGNLPTIGQGDTWLRGTSGNAGRVPSQVAEQMAGKRFNNFDEFRQEFWRTAANDPNLRRQFGADSLREMQAGRAPYAVRTQQQGGRIKYELDHNQELQNGGNVYDLNNIVIRTPLNHIRGK